MGNLAKEVTSDELTAYFSNFGQVVSVQHFPTSTADSPATAFVTFKGMVGVGASLAGYESHELAGRWVEVRQALPKSLAVTLPEQHQPQPAVERQQQPTPVAAAVAEVPPPPPPPPAETSTDLPAAATAVQEEKKPPAP